MNSNVFRLRTISSLVLSAVLAGMVAGCATPAPVVAVKSVGTAAMPIEEAVTAATEAVLSRIPRAEGQRARPDSGRAKTRLVLDPTLDASSGQQTAATLLFDRIVAQSASRESEPVELLPFDVSNVANADFLLTGTLLRQQAGGFRLELAMIDRKSGVVTAQATAQVIDKGVDMSPLAYYRDSPVLLKDAAVDGYIRTSATPAGQAADAGYMARIATSSVINDATMLYNAGRFDEALTRYRSALEMPAGDQLRVLNGIYLSTIKLGQTAKAEEAFGRVVAHGIRGRQLGVKFLFNPGSTEFWSDPKVSSAYGMWLRQIVRQGAAAKVCMDVVGHTSATGSEAVNDALSLKRALFIKQRMGAESPDYAARTRPRGMGSRQNIVGSGTDDVVDAPDRRVEFAIVDCAR